MSKFLALIFLITLSGFNSLGNFYFTYGIWPKSWWSFSLFIISGIIISLLINKVLKELQES